LLFSSEFFHLEYIAQFDALKYKLLIAQHVPHEKFVLESLLRQPRPAKLQVAVRRILRPLEAEKALFQPGV